MAQTPRSGKSSPQSVVSRPTENEAHDVDMLEFFFNLPKDELPKASGKRLLPPPEQIVKGPAKE